MPIVSRAPPTFDQARWRLGQMLAAMSHKPGRFPRDVGAAQAGAPARAIKAQRIGCLPEAMRIGCLPKIELEMMLAKGRPHVDAFDARSLIWLALVALLA